VHVRRGVVLEMQERRVERRQAVRVRHSPDSCCSGAPRQRPRPKSS
jgi:hypothetical protein